MFVVEFPGLGQCPAKGSPHIFADEDIETMKDLWNVPS